MRVSPQWASTRSVDAARIDQMRQGGQHHRPFRVAARGGFPFGVRHLLAAAPHVQSRRVGQPLVGPRDIAGKHEVDLRHARAETVAP